MKSKRFFSITALTVMLFGFVSPSQGETVSAKQQEGITTQNHHDYNFSSFDIDSWFTQKMQRCYELSLKAARLKAELDTDPEMDTETSKKLREERMACLCEEVTIIHEINNFLRNNSHLINRETDARWARIMKNIRVSWDD